uniref:TF-B3 domain-containing protein n=1 Tax=Aegilops tauschii subsp. strangulata TaxID=200361 RepID=A0A453AZN5_AEGTS
WLKPTRTRSSAGGRWRRTSGSWRSCACTTSPPPSARPPSSPGWSRKAPKPRDAADDAPPRRSGRIATLPEQPDYRDNVKLGTRKPWQQKEVKPDHAYAIAKAEELQDELGSDYPTFVKPMPQSLTSLHIPAQFSMEHLPDHGMRMVLVDEEEEEFKVCYRPHSSSLVAGWSEFAVDNELVEGDCLVFQLIKRALFKKVPKKCNSFSYEESA